MTLEVRKYNHSVAGRYSTSRESYTVKRQLPYLHFALLPAMLVLVFAATGINMPQIANAVNPECMLKENGGKTCFTLMTDMKTCKVVRQRTHEQSIKQMSVVFQAAVKVAS